MTSGAAPATFQSTERIGTVPSSKAFTIRTPLVLRVNQTSPNTRDLRLLDAVFVLLCAGGTRVEVQGVASSFDQLSVLVKPGDKISVSDVTGGEAEGRIGKLSRDTLTLVTEAGPRQFGAVDVAKIRERRDDSLTNGAIIGAVAGTAFFVTMGALLSDPDAGDVIVSTAIAGGVLFAGMGAAAGVGMDALIARRQ
jgi:hypothetical protein